MALNVRLSPTTERALNALAKRRGQIRSDVVREALDHYTAIRSDAAGDQSPYGEWADVIGIVRTGGRDPRKTTGELFSEIVGRKARARRSR
ncbi:MAG: ribbon-helix-helix protein, CopG family [Acidobacteriota bacterium]|nr:ribbon-helix-helix protein, CopG family [Acidobacteriota bacterium]